MSWKHVELCWCRNLSPFSVYNKMLVTDGKDCEHPRATMFNDGQRTAPDLFPRTSLTKYNWYSEPGSK